MFLFSFAIFALMIGQWFIQRLSKSRKVTSLRKMMSFVKLLWTSHKVGLLKPAEVCATWYRHVG